MHRKVLRSASPRFSSPVFCLVREKMPLPVECPFPSPCPNRPYSPYHLTSYFHSPSPERHDPSQGQEKENHCGCAKMRLCPCGLDPQSHTISHATRYVSTGWWNRGMGRFPPIHPDRCYVYIIIKFIYKYIIYNIRARVETYGPYVRRYLMGVCESKQ